MRTRTLRIAVAQGTAPYLGKSAAGAWTGFCAAMARDLAAGLGVELAVVEAAGDPPSALQADRVDLCFGLYPTVKRALAVDFSKPVFAEPVVVVTSPGYAPRSWAAIDRPSTRVAVENGSTGEAIAQGLVGQAAITGFKSGVEALQAVRSERSDGWLTTLFVGATAVRQGAPANWLIAPEPVVRAPFCIALRHDTDRRLRDLVDAWTDENTGNGQNRSWISAALAELSIDPADLPVTPY